MKEGERGGGGERNFTSDRTTGIIREIIAGAMVEGETRDDEKHTANNGEKKAWKTSEGEEDSRKKKVVDFQFRLDRGNLIGEEDCQEKRCERGRERGERGARRGCDRRGVGSNERITERERDRARNDYKSERGRGGRIAQKVKKNRRKRFPRETKLTI